MLIMSNFIIFAQKNYVAGYIVNLNGDTIRGEINFQNWTYNPKSIEFKLNEKYTETYLPNQIKLFYAQNRMYLSASILYDKSSKALNELDYNTEFNWTEEEVFLEAIFEGKKSLYLLNTKVNGENFFIKNNEKIEFLKYKKYKSKVTLNFENKVISKSNNIYITQLSQYFQDCESIKSKISTIRYTSADMISIFNSYGICKEKPYSFVFKKMKDSGRLEFGVSAGIALDNLKFNSFFDFQYLEILQLEKTQFKYKPGYQLGLSIDYFIPKCNNKLAVCNDLVYRNFNTSGLFRENVLGVYPYELKSSFSFSHIKLITMLKYKLPIKNNFFLSLGISNGVLIKDKIALNKTTEYSKTDIESVDLFFKESWIKKREEGFVLGINHQIYKVDIILRYEYANGFSNIVDFTSYVSSGYLLLRYQLL